MRLHYNDCLVLEQWGQWEKCRVEDY